jgi:hypothetical protein
LNLPPPATIASPFVSNQVLNQDIQLNIERMDLNEGASNKTRRVASINTSTNVPFNNSNTRPTATFSYPSIPYEQHQKNNIDDEGADADLVLGPAIKKKKSKTQVTVPIASNIINQTTSNLTSTSRQQSTSSIAPSITTSNNPVLIPSISNSKSKAASSKQSPGRSTIVTSASRRAHLSTNTHESTNRNCLSRDSFHEGGLSVRESTYSRHIVFNFKKGTDQK